MTTATPASPNRNPSHQRRPLRLVLDNPVVLKELRGRMRGARAFIVLTIYLLLLGLFTSLVYVAVAESSTSAGGQVNIGQIGRTLFAGVVAIELLLVSFIAPAFTSGAISGEREHQTYDLLRTTLLPTHWMVLGKLLSAMLFVLMLLLAAIPLQSIAFFFGGVAITEVLLAFVILFVTAMFFCTVGIYFSSRTSRTLSASVLTYSTATFFTFGLPILLGSVMLVFGLSLNDMPSSQAEIIALVIVGGVLSSNSAATALLTQSILINQQSAGTYTYTLSNGDTITLLSPWIPFTLVYLTLTIVFFLLAVRRVKVVER
ncbi:MAG: hypothetical protein JW966_16610 [Anaerolineae bacterium]|nr:hypothetical protein [Anaerolineae bacterium]